MKVRVSARIRTLALSAGIGCSVVGVAATLDRVEITHDDGRYHVLANSFLDAAPSAVHAVLLNFDDDAYAEISEIYKESAYLEPDGDGTPIVFTHVKGCLLLFCRSMRRVERLEVVTPRLIRTLVVPDRSDFRYAMSEWVLEPESGGTRVTYNMTVQPDFKLPPFIGPLFLRRFLLRGGVDAIDRIEELAAEIAASQQDAW